jgi:hypothetical protein
VPLQYMLIQCISSLFRSPSVHRRPSRRVEFGGLDLGNGASCGDAVSSSAVSVVPLAGSAFERCLRGTHIYPTRLWCFFPLYMQQLHENWPETGN